MSRSFLTSSCAVRKIAPSSWRRWATTCQLIVDARCGCTTRCPGSAGAGPWCCTTSVCHPVGLRRTATGSSGGSAGARPSAPAPRHARNRVHSRGGPA